jgi:hypothetical protein
VLFEIRGLICPSRFERTGSCYMNTFSGAFITPSRYFHHNGAYNSWAMVTIYSRNYIQWTPLYSGLTVVYKSCVVPTGVACAPLLHWTHPKVSGIYCIMTCVPLRTGSFRCNASFDTMAPAPLDVLQQQWHPPQSTSRNLARATSRSYTCWLS